MAEPDSGLSQKIIDALGTHKDFHPEKMRKFSLAITEQISNWKLLGEDRLAFPKKLVDLKKIVSKLKSEMQAFSLLLQTSPDAEQIDRETRQELDHVISNVTAHDFLNYFEKYSDRLAKHEVPPTSPRSDTEIPFTLARYIALNYFEHLNNFPRSSKGEVDKMDSPYDRVCNVIAEHLAVKIPPATRDRAAREIRQTCTPKVMQGGE